jgi:thioredoxin reductase/bacterioferritin-associated ferredoxin
MKRYDVIILGAGPAGAEAGVVASGLGLSALVIDEARAAGGQIFRAPDAWVANSVERKQIAPEGEALRRRLSESRVDLAFEHRVWMIASGAQSGFEVAAVGPAGALMVEAEAVIVATGATERFYPRPGWTLPGVIGLGAATVMLKAHRVLPGQRLLVAGPGPLAPLTAKLIQQGGGEVVAMVDPNPFSVWFKELPKMIRRPDLLAQGAMWLASLRASGAPILRGWDVRAIEGQERAESVTVGPVDVGWRPVASPREKRFAVDAVCLGYGLQPATEIYRLLGAAQEFVPARGGWAPELDTAQRTSVPRLYAAGDGASLLGMAAAPLTGRLAALSATFDLGKLPEAEYQRATAQTARALARVSRFGQAMARLVEPRASAMQAVDDSVVVCRCEDVTAGELRAAIAQGSSEINALKAATRCGMGPCGGRMCGEAAAALMECAGLERAVIGQWTARPPLRPIPLDALTGEFDYADIPIPEPAPL